MNTAGNVLSCQHELASQYESQSKPYRKLNYKHFVSLLGVEICLRVQEPLSRFWSYHMIFISRYMLRLTLGQCYKSNQDCQAV